MSNTDEPQPSMPPQPKTKELPQPTRAEIQLAEILTLAKATRADIAEVKADIDLIQTDVKLTKDEFRLRFVGIEGRITDLEVARVRTSSGVRQLSESDAADKAQLAQALLSLAEEKAKREALEKNVATKDDLKAVTSAQTSTVATLVQDAAKTPLGKKVLFALAGLLLVGINTATVWLTMKAHHDPVQIAPPAVVFIGPDGGVLPR